MVWKFERKITVANVIAVVAILGAAWGAWTAIVRASDNHETRIEALEKSAGKDADFQTRVLTELATIEADLTWLKGQTR